VRAQLDDLRHDLQGTVEDVRSVVEGLRPPALDEIGLTGAIRQAVGRLTSAVPTGGPEVLSRTVGALRATVVIGALPDLSAALEVAAYRIATEAVTNVVRHAQAARCNVSLMMDGSDLLLEVADDGRGLAPGDRQGHGLETMRERAEELGGTLTVLTNRPARPGTTVRAVLPVAPARSRS
jgi:signal transduction histidine kinase